MVYDMFTKQNMSMGSIRAKLNKLGIPSARNTFWSVSTISKMLQNSVYVGEIVWKRRPQKKSQKDGVLISTRPLMPEDQWIKAKGKHEPLVTLEIWEKAQEILNNRKPVPAPTGIITNPLAGLVRCEICGHLMVRRTYSADKPAQIVCTTPSCPNISSNFTLVEQRLLTGLRTWINQYHAEWELNKPEKDMPVDELIQAKKSIITGLEKKLSELSQQSGKLHDLLERGIYTEDVFLERSQNITERVVETKSALNVAISELETEANRKKATVEVIPKVENVLDLYVKTEEAALKNELLKSVLEVAVYNKTVRGHWRKPEVMSHFEIKLFPKLPK